VKALRWYGRGDVRLDVVSEPDAGPDEVLLRVSLCGICGSDIKEWRSGPVVAVAGRHPVTGREPPITLGHEFIGEVVAVGVRVTALDVGDRVAVEGEVRCGECWFCARGEYHLCLRAAYVGFNRDGGLAEFVAVPAVQSIPVPPDLPDLRAALVEPFAVALHAAGRAGLAEGQFVVVSGAGPVGLGAVIAARAAGAAAVIVVEPTKLKRDQALRFGATDVVSPEDGSIPEIVRDMTTGRGADVGFETAGHAGSLRALIEGTRKGGTIVTVGLHASPIDIDVNALTMAERRLVGSLGYLRDVQPAFDLLARRDLDPTEIVTAVVPLEDALERGFAALSDERDRHMKILISPSG
jgi:(R,R)-butanediol dehydrogenase / meso-butanediol dehydrogenase / diacetyl reductase